MIDLPATIEAQGARELANNNSLRSGWSEQRIRWLSAEIDPQIAPGEIVFVDGHPGHWLIIDWEWLDEGLALSLERLSPAMITEVEGDPGRNNSPADEIAGPTILRVFELPNEGANDPSLPLIFAAASSTNSAWRGAKLFVDQANGLIPIASVGKDQATAGVLVHELDPSNCIHFEAAAKMTIDLTNDQLSLPDTTISGIGTGANRILVGGEVVQYLHAEQLSDYRWQLSGLLRGRAGTEHVATHGHSAGTPATYIDENLTLLDSSLVASEPGTTIAAIGLGDSETVYTALENAGLSRRPFAPVHVRIEETVGGSLHTCWKRRARGQLLWRDGVDVPLIEETETYLVGYGPIASPFRTWSVTEPEFSLLAAEKSELLGIFGPHTLWVLQNGTFSNSPATLLTQL